MDYELRPTKDPHGQPLRAPKFIRENKAFDQLSGICVGILADGVVNEAEAKFFCDWMERHDFLRSEWPFNQVIDRVKAIYTDGVITDEERAELAEIMKAIVGHDETDESGAVHSTQLPVNSVLPDPMLFESREFVLTGKFGLGVRSKVASLIEERRGIVRNSAPTKETDYLVIGVFASRDWQYTNYGRKIEHAVSLRDSGGKICILPESHLQRFLVQA